jgi:hypothetical protein
MVDKVIVGMNHIDSLVFQIYGELSQGFKAKSWRLIERQNLNSSRSEG